MREYLESCQVDNLDIVAVSDDDGYCSESGAVHDPILLVRRLKALHARGHRRTLRGTAPFRSTHIPYYDGLFFSLKRCVLIYALRAFLMRTSVAELTE